MASTFVMGDRMYLQTLYRYELLNVKNMEEDADNGTRLIERGMLI